MGKKVSKLVDLPAGEIDQLVAQAKTISTAAVNHIFDLLFKEESCIRLSAQPKLALEMALIRILQSTPALPIDVLIDKLDMLREEMFAYSPPQEVSSFPPNSAIKAKDTSPGSQGQSASGSSKSGAKKSGTKTEETSATHSSAESADEVWKRITKTISNKNPSLAANLAKCKLKKIEGQRLEIEVPGNGFTLKMIQRDKNIAVMQEVCADILGGRKDIQLTPGTRLDDNYQKKKIHDKELKKKALGHPLVADAVEIFDGKLIDVKIV
jgi:DNA polymerase-3 subunit gamma/tau